MVGAEPHLNALVGLYSLLAAGSECLAVSVLNTPDNTCLEAYFDPNPLPDPLEALPKAISHFQLLATSMQHILPMMFAGLRRTFHTPPRRELARLLLWDDDCGRQK